MKRGLFLVLTALVIIVLSIVGFAQDQSSQVKGTIVAPPSTLGKVPGVAVHTPLYIFKPDGVFTPNNPPGSAQNPGSLACIYGVTPPTSWMSQERVSGCHGWG